MKTIDINIKEWVDKINGNSYFAGAITIDYGTKKEKHLNLPFQYGYGDHYINMAKLLLEKEKYIKTCKFIHLWRYCQDNKIILRTNKQKGCKKRELLSLRRY